MNEWLVVSDFDGTISRTDVTDFLLRRFADPAWLDVEAEWEQGQIGSLECMKRQVALLKVLPEHMLEALDTVDLDDDFSAFCSDCERLDVPVVILSDGLDLAINYLVAKMGIEGLPVVANGLRHVGEGSYAFSAPYSSPDCSTQSGVCKCAQIRKFKDRYRRNKVLYIGDGRSDFCGAEKADLVFARGKLLEFCRQRQLPHVPCEGFAHARMMLKSLYAFTMEKQPRCTPQVFLETFTL